MNQDRNQHVADLFSSGERGQTLAEYSLLVSIMALALFGMLAIVGDTVIEFFLTTGKLVADSIA